MDNRVQQAKTSQINAQTGLCAVIGKPVAHSLSPVMHNAAFQSTGLNYIYLAFEVADLEGCMAGMRALTGFRGMSVTIPHKISIMKYIDEIEPLARSVGCVNTVTNKDNRLIGTITDGLGTLRAFERTGVSLDNKSVLFIGTGGAARAVAFAMAATSSLNKMCILGRTEANVARLTQDIQNCCSIPVISGSIQDTTKGFAAPYDIIIHATPMVMYGHAEGVSAVPPEWLHDGQVVFDMVYRPRETKLIRDAAAAGCVIIPGLEMLLYQAALQFEMWTGHPAPETVMREALEDALQPAATE
jgi:shikimate dehydrogenase